MMYIYIFRSVFVLKEYVLMSETSLKETILTAKILKNAIDKYKLCKAFSKFYNGVNNYKCWFKNSSAIGHIRASFYG